VNAHNGRSPRLWLTANGPRLVARHETRLAEIVLSKTKTIPADEVVRVLTAHGIAAAKITKPVAERAGMKSLINRRIDVDAKT
jgi:hypothetical protein